jgi:hypothetical protein
MVLKNSYDRLLESWLNSWIDILVIEVHATGHYLCVKKKHKNLT